MKLIDADSLIRLIQIRYAWHKDYNIEEVIADIESAPVISDEKERRGEWIQVDKPRLGNPYRHYKCSKCGNPVPYLVMYCDHCGSKNL